MTSLMNNLISYLKQNKIKYQEIDDEIININGEIYYLVKPNEEGLLFSEDFQLMTDYQSCNKYVYCFGENWYWENKEDIEKPKLNELRYIGESSSDIKTESFLGIHGGYEILNGSRLYNDWCKKAKFLGCKILGIIEKNTLAGVLKFQIECEKNDIKPIIGATYTVLNEIEDFKYDLKFYVKDKIGWQNLLMINKEVNVINNKFITEKRLKDLIEGLFIIIDPKSFDFDKLNKFHHNINFYQADTVEYISEERDRWYLNNLKKFYKSQFKPISVIDAYYLESEHTNIKRKLNSISGIREPESNNQYFKDKEDYFNELEKLFNKDNDDIFKFYSECLNNEYYLVNNCNFKVELSIFHLPNYILTEEQNSKFGNKDNLFWSLIEEGLKNKVNKKYYKSYIERIEREFSVISQGEKLIDYFLILWDIVNWCLKNDILVGVGRGSSGGSLIAYLLNITNIDPIKYGLLFERFLNENRVKKSLPDIDTDFEGLRRDDVKSYMEYRFGKNNVCSVGTYGNLKLKMLFTDLARLESIPISEVKVMTSILGEGEKDGTEWNEIFYLASKSKKLKEFIKSNIELVNDSKLCLMQPRSSSIHACATIITPSNKDIFSWFPVKKERNKNGDDVLVSEWEGIQLDSAGFLKEDILGIAQLDKFSNIIKLIKQNKNINIDFRNIPLEDYKVFKYFHNGWNEDVFQFGTKGLKNYTKELKPDSIEELSAANALYRPGAMKSNAHNDFIQIKFGKKEIEYDYMLEDITKETYGLYLYQEQTMLAAQKLGNYNLNEADMLRKVMVGHSKKQEKDKFEFYKNKFLDGAIANNCDIDEAKKIWDKLEAFAGYGFNKSHAMAYAITGYISQWFKVNYPIEFWSTALQFADEKKIPDFISEINLIGDIKLMPVDINNSNNSIHTDFKNKIIYWQLSSVKQCGEKASEQIFELRNKDGQFFSLEEFIDRSKFKGTKVTKQIIENLIMSGAFDEIEFIEYPSQRYRLIQQYRNYSKIKINKEKDIFELNKNKLTYDWWWILQQKKLSSIAFFDYKNICETYLSSSDDSINIEDFQLESYSRSGKKVKICGIITQIEEKESKKGKWCKILLECNYHFINIIIWPEQYKVINEFNFKEKDLLLISGKITWNSYRNENILQTYENTEFLILE